MKKILIASIVALTVALVGAASANAAFNTNLSVGSTGSDVAALQTWLISKGFSIPSIASGVATPGYFGQQTKAAVIAYQASVKLPTTGFVGPLTRGLLNGGTTGTPVATAMVLPFTCPAGYTAPVGWVCPGTTSTPVTPVNPNTPIVMDGTDGSLTASLSSYASNVTIKKGETKDLVAVKLQATAAPVSVTRFDARFNTRPWLYFGKLTLKDSTGAVIATKNLSSSADATEITVGSDYLVRFDNISTVITPGTDRTLVVEGMVLSTTDKLTSDVSVIVSVPDNSIRTINGKGYTDSIGLGTVATSGTSGRTATLSSSGSTGNILVKLNASSPDTRIQKTSTSGETTGVVLGAFDFKSENRASTINTLKFSLNSPVGPAFSTIIKRLYVTDGTKTVQVDSVATTSTFSNLTFDLPEDQWVKLSVVADIADQDDFAAGTLASTSITVNTTNIVGIDTNYTTVTASGANTVVANNVTFQQTSASVSTMSATAVLVDNGTSKAKQATIGYRFTLNNTGSNDLYMAKSPNTAFATSSTVATAASSTLTAALTTTSPVNNQDTATAYLIPAGQSRTFIYTGLLDNTNGTAANHASSITKIYFADDSTNLTEFNIGFGLEALQTPALNI